MDRNEKLLVSGIGVVCLFLGGVVDHLYIKGKPPEPVERVSKSEPVKVQAENPCKDRMYIVVTGDNYSVIAGKMYGGRRYMFPALIEVNGAKYPYIIHVGDKIIVPCNFCVLPHTTFVIKIRKKVVKNTTITQITLPCPTVATPVCPTLEPAPKPVLSPVPPTVQSQPTPERGPPAVTPTPQPAPVPVPETPKPQAKTEIIPQSKVTPLVEKVEITLPSPPVVAPGSAWNGFGTTPIERDNWVNAFHIDQGLIVWGVGKKLQVEPYVAVNVTKDTKGYQWNNKAIGEVGIKLIRPFNRGIVFVGGAYASEYRFSAHNTPAQNRSGPIGYISDWFGWNQPTARSSSRTFFTSLPGSTWTTVGNISPFEKNNVIGLGRVEQGVTLMKIGGVSIIPQAVVQGGFDTQSKPWNNRYIYGGELKVAIPWKTGTLDLKGGYQCANQYRGPAIASSGSMCGPTVSVSIWTGWRLRGGGK